MSQYQNCNQSRHLSVFHITEIIYLTRILGRISRLRRMIRLYCEKGFFWGKERLVNIWHHKTNETLATFGGLENANIPTQLHIRRN